MENNSIGFLKRSQIFRKNVKMEKYFPILDGLYNEIVFARHLNNLPTYFSLKGPFDFSTEDVEFVLSTLYPQRKYVCKRIEDSIVCIRQ